ncbi:hypothetical protein [Clostridium sp.]|uniref:hypothetical protein n=1 Tax=Clostridium sp. TaxID=1506 RepID=UPI0032170F82
MEYKIMLILNRSNKMRVCEQYYDKNILLDKCIIERGLDLTIVYENGASFTHEIVESVEGFEEYGLKITTTKKVWFIHG